MTRRAAGRRLRTGRVIRVVVALAVAMGTALPFAGSVASAAPAVHFNDTPPSNAFYGDITWLVQQDVTTGYPDGGFHPAAAVSRQAMAAFLYRFKNHASFPPCTNGRPFPDVPASGLCGAIAWLASTGITSGYADGNFHPAAPVSRQAMAQFMYKLSNPGTSPAGCSSAAFTDVPAQSPFCPAIGWLVGQGIVDGYADGSFQPTAAVSRQAMAAFLHRLAHPAPPTSVSHYLRANNVALATAAGQADGAADAHLAAPHLHLLDIGDQIITAKLPSPGVTLSATTVLMTYAQLVTMLEGYLDGYASAAPGSAAQIAVGTNSDGEFSKYTASAKGTAWATDVINPLIAYATTKAYHGLTVTGADDIEAGFAATEAQAQQWETAYLAATSAPLVYNGSADGCSYSYGVTGGSCNHGWTEQQYYGLAGGTSAHRITVLPQIYNDAQAVQWANIDATGGGQLTFTGTLTELQACRQAGSCSSFAPERAWIALWNALTAQGYQAALPATTDLMINS